MVVVTTNDEYLVLLECSFSLPQ